MRLTVGLVLFVIALTYEVRAVMRSGRPILRAADALALVIPIFMVVFAWTYLTLARSDPHAFSQPLERVSALYFTVTVFSTVGFGDITPVTDPARVAVMAQMLCDLIFIAVVVRLILEAARGTLGARANRREVGLDELTNSVRPVASRGNGHGLARRWVAPTHRTGRRCCDMQPSEAVGAEPETSGSQRLALLLAMAMFVLVVDTSLMNVSISSVVQDLDTTVSGVQSAIALEALVSAAFILIGSKVGDLIGRKKAYVLGLARAMRIGALAMALAQSLVAVIIFWAIIGGLGASLLLPAMQSLIHGNFEGAAQKKAYALVGASAAIAAAVGPLLGGFITTYLSWRVAFLLEDVVIVVVLSGIRLVRDAPYTGDRHVDVIGAALSVVGMGGIVLSVLVWQEGGEAVGALMVVGAAALGGFVYWLVSRKRQAKPTLIDPDLFKSKVFRFGITGQMLQQIALGGTMIALPIFLQMVLEYNAMQAGLSLAPLSLTMFATALVAAKKAGTRRPSAIIGAGVRVGPRRDAAAAPDRAEGEHRLVPGRPAHDRGMRTGPVGLAAEQLHPRPDIGGTSERSGRRELRRRIVRTLVRARIRRRHHAGDAVVHVHAHGRVEQGAATGGTAAGRADLGPRRRDHEQHAAPTATRRPTAGDPGRDHPHQHGREAACTASRAPRADPRGTRWVVELPPDVACAGPDSVGRGRGHRPRLTRRHCPVAIRPEVSSRGATRRRASSTRRSRGRRRR